jgi:hypothetical protein
MVFVFANTGEEREETLEFAHQCSIFFGFPLVWIEGKFNKERGIGTGHKIVTFETASRNGEPFEAHCSTYGIPNQANPQCTRELKAVPIKSFARSLGWKKYWTAIGIRVDEIDRIDADRIKKMLYYPLCEDLPTTKPEINVYWIQQPFRLKLKGYEGNCKWCWKKSYKKLLRLAKDHPEFFDFPKEMERKYGNYMPEHRLIDCLKKGKEGPKNITFFRDNKSAIDILNEAKVTDPIIFDDSRNYSIQTSLLNFEFDDSESCEVWSECK